MAAGHVSESFRLIVSEQTVKFRFRYENKSTAVISFDAKSHFKLSAGCLFISLVFVLFIQSFIKSAD